MVEIHERLRSLHARNVKQPRKKYRRALRHPATNAWLRSEKRKPMNASSQRRTATSWGRKRWSKVNRGQGSLYRQFNERAKRRSCYFGGDARSGCGVCPEVRQSTTRWQTSRGRNFSRLRKGKLLETQGLTRPCEGEGTGSH